MFVTKCETLKPKTNWKKNKTNLLAMETTSLSCLHYNILSPLIPKLGTTKIIQSFWLVNWSESGSHKKWERFSGCGNQDNQTIKTIKLMLCLQKYLLTYLLILFYFIYIYLCNGKKFCKIHNNRILTTIV